MTVRALAYDPCEQVRVWYVVFEGEVSELIVNHVAQGLLVDVCRAPVEHCALAEVSAGRRVVMVAGCLEPRYTQRVMSCVEIVKSLLGVSAWRVWTPRQLHKHLILSGGVEL